MASHKLEYFRKGINDQKRPDIVFEIRRTDEAKMDKWSADEKKHLKTFLDDCEDAFLSFSCVLSNSIDEAQECDATTVQSGGNSLDNNPLNQQPAKTEEKNL